ATCERGFAAMEESHQKVIEELQRKYQRELENLKEEKERLEELCSFQREIEVLSEQYSQKCLENAHLAQALEAERQALRQCQRENQELNAHNQVLHHTDLWYTPGIITASYILHVSDKKYATDKYKDIYTELSIVKAKAERDLGRLKEQLQLAHEALGEPSLEDLERGGYVVMEQPPGSLDDLQYQGVSASTLPSVTDLTRKEEECLLSSPSLDALRRVKGSGWAPNAGSTIPLLQFSETGSSDVALRSGDQIHPDNALSHTTVTLSYVSRSHVFSTHNSPLYSVSPISRFSLHPHCNTDNRFGETSCALNQHNPEQDKKPINLATQAEPFPLFSQPQVGPEDDAREYYVQEPPEFNVGVLFSDGYKDQQLGEEEKHSILPENKKCLENGQHDDWSIFGAHSESSSEIDDERGTSDVLFIEAKKLDQVVSDSGGATDLGSVSREYKSPLEDSVSPPSTSVDDAEDVFLLPQASRSPSADGFYPESADDAVHDTLSTDEATRASSVSSVCPTRIDASDPSDESKRSYSRCQAVSEPLIDLTGDACVSHYPENKTGSVVPHVNGNANALERTIKERKLPMRSGRGTRLEAIVMNINSSRYKVSGCILASKKPSASQPTTHDSAFPGSKKTLPGRRRKGKVKTTFSRRAVKRKAVNEKKGKPRNDCESRNDSTSVSVLINETEMSGGSTPAKKPRFAKPSRKSVHLPQSGPVKSKTKPPSQSSAQFHEHKNSKKKPELLSAPKPSVEMNASKVSFPGPPPKSPKNNQGDTKARSPESKASPTKKTKAAHAPKWRRKKPKHRQPSSIFSPKEPEIKLKYVNFKEEKKDLRLDSFSPFVRVKRQQPSPVLCTIINYPEEIKTEPKQQQAHSSRFISAVVPSTSSLQLGRPSTHSQHQRALVCCLCGQSANSIDLGDLHGPYYPEGYQPNTKAPPTVSGLKEDEDDSSDSDSSSSIMRARHWACSQGTQLKQKGPLGSRRRPSGRTSSPAAKQARLAGGMADVEDWYSPPLLSVEPCEYWLHEDCGIWSAGVFLVKGKVYGLEEAVKVAQETVKLLFNICTQNK
ncbi:hypothetical protein XENOCAPTIV_005635, partial [Xenoophorus captivus]